MSAGEILVIGGKRDRQTVKFLGRAPMIDGDKYVYARVEGVEVYALAGVGIASIAQTIRARRNR